MEVVKINDIKEVVITPKKAIKYYALISNDVEINDPEFKYFIWHQSTDLQSLINYEKNMQSGKQDGRVFKIYCFHLPA